MNTTQKQKRNKKTTTATAMALSLAIAAVMGWFAPHTVEAGELRSAAVQTAKENFAPDTDAETINREINYRYADPEMVGMMGSMNWTQAINAYREVSNTIDTRHYAPASYTTRTQQAMKNLMLAIENPAFTAASSSKTSPEKIAYVKGLMQDVVNRFEPKTAEESLRALNWSAGLLQKYLGTNPTAVAMEFIHGSIDSLDKYSAIVPTPNGSAPRVELSGKNKMTAGNDQVVGIGIELKGEELGARVVRPLQGSPAEAAGLKRGDLLLAVNGQDLAGDNLGAMADKIKGVQGTHALIKVQRGENAPFLVTVTRKTVQLKSLSEVRMIDEENKVGYIRIDKFAEDTTQLLDEGLWKLFNAGMQSLVVDVRGNPGGLLTAAIDISNRFIPNGTIVSTKGRTAGDNMSQSATYAQTWKVPLVVLVDENSASASEIFAAAIQDNNRGKVVGRKSYGKGTVQTHFPLTSIGAHLKLTTAKFFSPNGREMAGAGVTPDINIELPEGHWYTAVDPDIAAGLSLANGTPAEELLAGRVKNATAGPQS